MNATKRGVIVGMVLGDGYVQVRKRPRVDGSIYEERNIRVLHGPKQRAYCEWKATRLSWALGGQQVNVTKCRNGPGGRYWAYQFSKSHPYFGQIRRWCYPAGVKTLTRNVLNMLTPEGLAIWYMDDGSARRNVNSKGWVSSVASDIATMCTRLEAETIVDWFMDEYGIEWKIRYRKASPENKACYIQTNTAGSKAFAGIIKPYVPECMLYKLAHVATLMSHERQTPLGVCVNAECDRPVYENRRQGLCDTCYSRWYRKR